MLTEIVEHIFQTTGQRLIDPTQKPVSGGDISKAYLIGDRQVQEGL